MSRTLNLPRFRFSNDSSGDTYTLAEIETAHGDFSEVAKRCRELRADGDTVTFLEESERITITRHDGKLTLPSRTLEEFVTFAKAEIDVWARAVSNDGKPRPDDQHGRMLLYFLEGRFIKGERL